MSALPVAADPHKAVGVVEYVRALSSQDQATALYEILRELIRVRGDKDAVYLRTPEGQWLGYFLPPGVKKVQFQVTPPKLTPEQIQESQATIDSPDDILDMEEFMRRMHEEDRD